MREHPIDLRDQLQRALGDAYSLERELGGGGMSRVFAATERALGRTVVVKVIAPGLAEGVSAERFGREIQLAASLQQANIVPLLAAGDAGGVPYYTMPFVQGESLRGRLATGAPFSISEGVGILRDVARALSYAHARGVVHRDIKPDNVLLSHGAAVVTDFGIAKAVSAARTNPGGATLTQAGTSIGTPAYMAPEQVAGDPNVDHRVDLYAWGCLAYEVFTGAPPFVRESPQRVLAAHLGETPAPIASRRADLPLSLATLVMRCLAKAPAERPASADEILRDLDAVFTPGTTSAERPTPAGGRVTRRNLLIAAVVVAAAVTALGTLRNRGRGAAPPAAAQERSVAVLPLANLSGDKADDYFGVGLSEEMTRALSKNGVRVIGRVSAGALQAKGMDEREIARQLGVGSLLTGSVQRAEGQVRINVSLISAADGAVRWTEKYDRPLMNVFAVQDEIARMVAAKLLGSFGGARTAAASKVETADPEVYALFLQGQVLFNRRTAQSLKQAISLFEQATARDPKFARAQAMLAMSDAVLPNYDFTGTEASQDKALAAATRAIAIDSTVAEAYTAMAWVRAARGASREADRLYTRALALDSTVATAWGWHGLLAYWKGDFALAHRRVARARELEPVSLIVRTWDVQILLNERRFAEAEAATQRIIEMDSTFAVNWSSRADALIGLGQYAEAVGIMERRVAMLPPTPATETHGILAYAYARAGNAAKAREMLDRMRSANGGKLPPMGVVAATTDLLGDRDAAVSQLADAIAKHDPWVDVFSRSERYDRLRQDPRAAAMLTKVGSW
ncbi:MAG TPA: protein kinase [Gemmatimonadaceae bacterium]|nr:protein kinase [Gemmatimonadaceae bacterium]